MPGGRREGRKGEAEKGRELRELGRRDGDGNVGDRGKEGGREEGGKKGRDGWRKVGGGKKIGAGTEGRKEVREGKGK